jgi:hypothetical protein|tara:strand:- start:371 stop:637 length:267 start_codon:yes stop_codon:yes gene_type:complete
MNKKFKLTSGKEVTLLEMSVDDIDFCSDVTQIVFDKEGNQIIKNMSAARTAWIRKGVKGANDKFIKTLSDTDKNELSLKVREYQELGE